MNSSCLVLEGGGLRGAFTSGVLEYLLEQGIEFPEVIGVSAGACIGATFLARQAGRNRKIYVDTPSDPRFMGWRYFLSQRSYFNMKFLFDTIPHREIPFDEQAFYANPAGFLAVTTALADGRAVFFDKTAMTDFGLNPVLCASSSIPFLSPPVALGGQLYYDGGVGDSIPAQHALAQHGKAVVILTRPGTYRKQAGHAAWFVQWAFRRHPEFARTLRNRSAVYNESLDYCARMEKAGRLLVLRPSASFATERTEKDPARLGALYQHGYDLMRQECARLREFLA